MYSLSKLKDNYQYTVCTRCFTYNHEAFILDALNGFVAQITDFPVVFVVVDDASTDNEPQIIRDFFYDNFNTNDSKVAFCEKKDYGEVLYAQHKTNKNCFFAIVLLRENHYQQKKSKLPYLSRWLQNAKYIAICEGDDYWTGPFKLQKQVRFLEDNPEYIICSHNFTRFYQDSFSFDSKTFYSKLFPDATSFDSYDYSLDTFFDGWWTQPLTCLYRNRDFRSQIPFDLYRHFRDDVFYYYVLKNGKGGLLSDSMGVYRIHQGGVWSNQTMVQRYENAEENAFTIYKVEGDIRAFNKIDREESRILRILLNDRRYLEIMKRLNRFKRMAPKNHFRSVRKGFWDYVLSKIQRKLRKAVGH